MEDSDIPTTNTSNVTNPEGFLFNKQKPIFRKKINDYIHYIDFEEWLENKEKLK